MPHRPADRPTPTQPRRVRLSGAIGIAAAVTVLGVGVGFLGGMAAESASSHSPRLDKRAALVGYGGSGSSSASGSSGSMVVDLPTDDLAADDSDLAEALDRSESESDARSVATVGSVVAISGPDFIVRDLGGEEHRVCTTNGTQVSTLRGNGGVRNLAVGDPVFFKGDSDDAGVVTAKIVIAGSFPDLGAGSR